MILWLGWADLPSACPSLSGSASPPHHPTSPEDLKISFLLLCAPGQRCYASHPLHPSEHMEGFDFWLFYLDFIWREELLCLPSPGMIWVQRQKVGHSWLWGLASHVKAAACFWLATDGIPRTLGPLDSDSYHVFSVLLRRQASSAPLLAWLIMSDHGHLVTQLWLHLYFL